MLPKLGGEILNNVGEHLIQTFVQSRLEGINRWRFDNIGPNDPNGEGGLPAVQPDPRYRREQKRPCSRMKMPSMEAGVVNYIFLH